VKELLKKNSLEELESEYDDSTDFVKRQVIFCARWSLDNLCEFFVVSAKKICISF